MPYTILSERTCVTTEGKTLGVRVERYSDPATRESEPPVIRFYWVNLGKPPRGVPPADVKRKAWWNSSAAYYDLDTFSETVGEGIDLGDDVGTLDGETCRVLSAWALDVAERGAQDADALAPLPKVALFVRRKGSPDSPVASIEEAARRWNEFRDRSGAGVSEIGSGVAVLDGSGKTVARITYNGTVWLPGSERFNDSLGAFDDPPEPRHHGRFHVSRHALGQGVQGSLGRGGIEYEVFDSGEKPSRLVFVSRNEDEAIAESLRLNAGGAPRAPRSSPPENPPPKPEWIAAPAIPATPPGKARCSVCGKVGSKKALAKHVAGCKSGNCKHPSSPPQGSLFGNPTPAEKDIARRIAAERKKRGDK